jgi:hypothetical protein
MEATKIKIPDTCKNLSMHTDKKYKCCQGKGPVKKYNDFKILKPMSQSQNYAGNVNKLKIIFMRYFRMISCIYCWSFVKIEYELKISYF